MKTSRNSNPHWPERTPKTLITTPVGKMLSSEVLCRRSGISKNFYRFDFPDWVNIIAKTADNKLLMIEQYRFGSGQMEWEIPGGAVETGEAPLAAGLRELLEETGYAGENGTIIGKVCPNPALQHNFCYTAVVENVKQVAAPNFDEMEDITVCPMSIAKVMSMVRDGVIQHGLVLNALLFYQLTCNKVSFCGE